MAFLLESDYNVSVRADLFSLVTATTGVRQLAERQAKAEISSYLGNRYDLTKLFRAHTVWSPATEYTFNQLVVITADDYVSASTYVVDDLVVYLGKVYIAIDAVSAAEDPVGTPAKWTLIGEDETFYTALKTDDFLLGTIYTVGQYVVYNSVRYIVTVETTGYELPTDTNFWAVDSTTVAAGTLPTVTASWEVDERDPLIIMHMVNLSAYLLSAQANPRGIREDIGIRREDSINWLKMAADPRKNITPNFPEIVQADKHGFDAVWNSNTKLDHGQTSY